MYGSLTAFLVGGGGGEEGEDMVEQERLKRSKQLSYS